MGQEIGHHAVHQEREIFPSASFSDLGIRGLGSEPTAGYREQHNTGNVPLSCHLTPNEGKHALCCISQCSKRSSDTEAHARSLSRRNLTTGPDSG